MMRNITTAENIMTGTSETSMPNGTSFEAKVYSLDSDVADLKQSVDTLGKRLVISHDQLSSKIDSQGEKLYAKFDTLMLQASQSKQTQWPVIISLLGLILVFCGTVGGLAYWPIKGGIEDIRNVMFDNQKTFYRFMTELPDKYVGLREHDRLMKEVDQLRSGLVSKELFESVTRDISRRTDGNVRRLEHVETEFFKPVR